MLFLHAAVSFPEIFFFGKWKALADDYVIREKKNQRNVFLLGTASGLVSNLANVGANILAILLLTQGKLSVGALGAVFALIGTLMGSTTQLFGSIANFLSKKNEAAQFFELIDLREQISGDDTPGDDAPDVPAEGGSEHGGETLAKPCGQPDIAGSKAAQPNGVQPDTASAATDLPAASRPVTARPAAAAFLEARSVSYRYPLTDQYRIQDVSFRIEKGEKVAFVGENGAGKSTFVKLLTGMLEPSIGQIFLDGRNTGKMDSAYRYNSQLYSARLSGMTGDAQSRYLGAGCRIRNVGELFGDVITEGQTALG